MGSNTSTLQCRLIGLVSPESTPHQNDRTSRFTSTYTLILLAIDAPPDIITSATMDIRLSISVSPPRVLLSPSPNPLPVEAPHPSTSISLPPEAIYSSKEELYKAIQAFAAQHHYTFIVGRSNKIHNSPRIKIFYNYDRYRPLPPDNHL